MKTLLPTQFPRAIAISSTASVLQGRGRAQLSPLLRRSTQDALTRARVAARLKRAPNGTLPAPDSLTPPTPALAERWWTPRLLDRLQMPLTRFRD